MKQHEPRKSPFRTTQKGREPRTVTQKTRAAVTNIRNAVGRASSTIVNALIPHRETHLHDGDDPIIEISGEEPEEALPGMLWVVPDGAGMGDTTYVTTLKGIARGRDLLTDTPTWTAINTGLSGNALLIRALEFDPFSASASGYTRAFLMTDDGVYRCENLTATAPSWTQVLTAAAAAALVSKTAGDMRWSYGLATSERYAGLVVALAGYYYGSSYWFFHFFYSTDYGTTWTANAAKFVEVFDTASPSASYNKLYLYASKTRNVVYTWGEAALRGSQSAAGSPSPNVHLCYWQWSDGNVVDGASYGGSATTLFAIPESDTDGDAYADDNVGYATKFGSGTNALARITALFNPEWSNGYTPPTGTMVGDSTMTGFYSEYDSHPHIHPANENYILCYSMSDGTTQTWITDNGGATWLRTTGTEVGGLYAGYWRAACWAPQTTGVCLFIADNSSGSGYARIFYTEDNGATWSDAGSAALDTALSITANSDLTWCRLKIDPNVA